MFNDKYGLTKAVLDKRKTKTRRIVAPHAIWSYPTDEHGNLRVDMDKAPYHMGEIVAIAQSYGDVCSYYTANGQYAKSGELHIKYIGYAGWRNKMFVRADLMPHHIKITNMRVEKLQDIDAKDCLCEGVIQYGNTYRFTFYGAGKTYPTPVAAFQALIKKLDRKMWAANPYVWVYEFELVD